MNAQKQKLVIGISGTLAAGKGVVAEILSKKGCDITTLGAVVRESLNSKNIETTRENQQNEGNNLRKEFGGQVLVERALKKVLHNNKILIIDGIRNVAEIDYLRNNSKFFLIGVDAPIDKRYERSTKRHRDPNPPDYDKFIADDARDRGVNEPLNGQQVGMCLVQADFLINNDEIFTKLEDSKLYKDVNELYRDILKKK